MKVLLLQNYGAENISTLYQIRENQKKQSHTKKVNDIGGLNRIQMLLRSFTSLIPIFET